MDTVTTVDEFDWRTCAVGDRIRFQYATRTGWTEYEILDPATGEAQMRDIGPGHYLTDEGLLNQAVYFRGSTTEAFGEWTDASVIRRGKRLAMSVKDHPSSDRISGFIRHLFHNDRQVF